MEVTGLDHVVLVVADVERSIGFYRDLLGVGAERLEEWRRGEMLSVSLSLPQTTIIDHTINRTMSVWFATIWRPVQ